MSNDHQSHNQRRAYDRASQGDRHAQGGPRPGGKSYGNAGGNGLEAQAVIRLSGLGGRRALGGSQSGGGQGNHHKEGQSQGKNQFHTARFLMHCKYPPIMFDNQPFVISKHSALFGLRLLLVLLLRDLSIIQGRKHGQHIGLNNGVEQGEHHTYHHRQHKA